MVNNDNYSSAGTTCDDVSSSTDSSESDLTASSSNGFSTQKTQPSAPSRTPQTSHYNGSISYSEQRLKALTRCSYDLISEVDDNGLITYLSPSCTDILGYTPEELLGKPWRDLIHPEDMERLLNEPPYVTAEGIVKIRVRSRHKNGTWRLFNGSGYHITLDNGDRRFITVTHDITAEERHIEEFQVLLRLTVILNSQPDLPSIAHHLSYLLKPLFPFDFLALTLDVGNEPVSVTIDTTDDSDVRRSFSPVDDWPGLSAAQQAPWSVNARNARQDAGLDPLPDARQKRAKASLYVPLVTGDQVLGLLRLDSIQAGVYNGDHERLAGLIGVQVAVAVRQTHLRAEAQAAAQQAKESAEHIREAEEQAREAGARYRRLVNRLDAIVWEADLRTAELTFVSPQAEKLLGYPREAWLGPFTKWAQMIHPDDRAKTLGECESANRRGEDHQLEYRMVARDGRIVWVRDAVVIELQDGKPVRLNGVIFDITERKEQEEKLRHSERKFRAIFESSLDAIFILDDAMRFVRANEAGLEMLGVTEADLLQRALTDFIMESDHDELRREWRNFLHKGSHYGELRICCPDNRILLIEHRSRAHFLPGNHLTVARDYTQRKNIEEDLYKSNAILHATQEAAADGMLMVDNEGNVVSYNRRFEEMWGVPHEPPGGESPDDESPDGESPLRVPSEGAPEKRDVMYHVLSMMQDPDEFISKVSYLCDHRAVSTRDEVPLRDGRVFERYSAPALSPQGHIYGRVWSFSDLTEHKKYEQRLTHQAFHDPLTGLPNRALFMDRLTGAMARSQRADKLTAVLFLDLDRFKVVNDSLGHENGDQLLIEVSRRLKSCLRPGDTAARFGGDEFTVLLETVSHPGDATVVAERIADALQAPFDLNGHEFCTNASIGIVISNGSDRPEDLLRDADVAMYRAKNKGGAQYEVFDVQMSIEAMNRLRTEIELRHAIKRRQLRLHFQPLIDLNTNQVVGAEALIRWQHPVRGLIMPGEFIALAEESGIIFAIGEWVLREACHCMRTWEQLCADIFGQSSRPFFISVNLSARQFQKVDLVEDIARVLKECDLSPDRLNLEITESVVMEDAETTIKLLEALKKLGVRLSVDDFGTGYSSLSYLKRFPLDTLKVDRSLISRTSSDERDVAIVQAVHSLGQALDMKVVAEGVETAEQMQRLHSLGVDFGQGYLFSKPLSENDFLNFLRNQAPY